MPENDLSAKLGLDSTDFKTQIITLQREIRVLESGFRASTAGMGDWANKASGLELRGKALTSQMEVQAEKIRRLRGEYERIAKEKGENDRESKELQIRLNKETEVYGKLQTELGQTNTKLTELKNRQNDAGKSAIRLGAVFTGLSTHVRGVFGNLKSFSTGVASMSRSIGSSVVNMGKTIGHTVGNITRSVGQLVKYVGTIGLAAGAIAGALLGSTIAPARDLAETVSKVGVVFDASAERVLEFGKRAALAVGMSENAALSAAGTYGNLFRSMGIGSDASADMSINLVKLAGDLASFNNLSPDEVLEKLRAGLTGESEPLKTLGVNINEATIKAKAMELGLLRAGEEMNAAAKAQAAYALIFEQTALAQGDFARTSGGLANQQRIWAAQVENLKAKIGAGLVPALASILTLGNELLASDAVQNWAGNLAKSLEKVGTFIGPIRRGFATGGITKGLDAIGETFKTMFPILNVVLGPLGRIIGYISDLIGIIQGADSVSGAAEGIGGLIAKIFGDTATARTNMATTAVSFISGFVDGIVGALPQLATLATTLLMAIVNGLLTAIPILIPVAITIINLLVQFLIQNLPKLITMAVQLIVTLAKGISEALPKLIPEVAKIIPVIILALIENLPMLVEAALQLIIALAEGLIVAIPILLAAVPEIMTALIGAIVLLWPKIKKAGEDLIKTVVDGVTAAWPKMQESGKKIGNIFLDGVKENIAKFLQIGKDIVSGVWDGIKERTTWFTDQVTGFFSGIVDAVKKTLGISSPSKVFSGIGENMALGLGSGFSGAFRQIERDVQGAIAGMSAIPSPSLSLAGGGISGGRGAGAAPNVTVPIQATVRNDLDLHVFARLVALEIKRASSR